MGDNNSFFGGQAGLTNTTGSGNTIIGRSADVGSGNLTNATAIGAFARVSQSNSLVLGNGANVGIGTTAPSSLLHLNGPSSPNPISAMTIDVQSFQTFGNAEASHFFRVRDIGAGGASAFLIRGDGKVGIGTDTPAATLEVNGYTKLGSDAPSIRVKKLTGTTAATEGGILSIETGLDQSKILSITVMVSRETTAIWVPPSWLIANGYRFNWVLSGPVIYVTNVAGGSANILSKPIKILIIYEQ